MKDVSKSKLVRFSQIVYLTVTFYFQNNLGIAASSCTFGFIFSFVPILMMILTSCIGLLRVSPSIVDWISDLTSKYGILFNVHDFVASISTIPSISGVNIVLAFFIIWMARKLFLSIIQSMRTIFKTVAPARPVINQLLTFAGELLLVIICAVVFFAAFLTRQILTLPIFNRFQTDFPLLFSSLSNNIVNITLYLILFIFTTICFKVASGTKPQLKSCIGYALGSVVVFSVIVFVISTTINRVNYSTIYGVLSNLMILLFEMWFFFSIFLFFAQMLYVEQFFDSLLIGELYLLPKHDTTNIFDSLRRILFITPGALMTKENLEIYEEGQPIYKIGNETDGVYYVVSGTVCENKNGTIIYHDKGSSFGDAEFIMNTTRIGEATAITKCSLIKISKQTFSQLIEKNPKAAAKAISTISYYTEKLSSFVCK